MPKEYSHKDILGVPIDMNSKLAVSIFNSLMICSVVKMSEKKIRVKALCGTYKESHLVYPSDTIVISGEEALAYILKGQ